MSADPTLEALIAGGHYAIAADRYEEQTGDAELAALMRIDGLEWELVDGVPALKVVAEYREIAKNFWWNLRCGIHLIGTVLYPQGLNPIQKTSLPVILSASGYSQELAPRFYQLCLDAVPEDCEC